MEYMTSDQIFDSLQKIEYFQLYRDIIKILLNGNKADAYAVVQRAFGCDCVTAIKVCDRIKWKEKLPISDEPKPQEIEQSKPKESTRKYVPRCPTCGSPDIRSISGTKRFISTGIFGLASSNIGKQRICKNCGYKW